MIRFFPLKFLFITIIINSYLQLLVFAKSQDIQAIASLKNLEGTVKIQSDKSKKGVYAREGMILYNGNKIITGLNSKTGILYRDGSKIRLFQNSKLILNFSEENFLLKRNFKHLLTLKKGSFRARFKKGLKATKIRTPTAIVGIKGTSFRISEKENFSTISLTEGQLEISNLTSKITLSTGQWLKNFGKYTNLSENIASLPNILSTKANVYELFFQEGRPLQVEINIQIQNRISGKSIKRKGLISFESNFKNINLPRKVLLDERGFAKIMLFIKAPSLNDQNFFGLIKIRSFLDDENFYDVADGLLVLKVKNFRKKRTLILHPDKGIFQ